MSSLVNHVKAILQGQPHQIHLALAIQRVSGHFVLAKSAIIKKWLNPIIMSSSGVDFQKHRTDHCTM